MDNKPYVKNITYKIKYLPTWVYAAIVKADPESRDKLLQITDLLNSYEFPADSVQCYDDYVVFTKFPMSKIDVMYIFGYIMNGIHDYITGIRHRNGIVGIGADEFIPNSDNDLKFIIEECFYYDTLNYNTGCDYSCAVIELYLDLDKYRENLIINNGLTIDEENDKIEVMFRRKMNV